MKNKLLGKKTFIRITALAMSAVMAFGFNVPDVKAAETAYELGEDGDSGDSFHKTTVVKNYDEIVNALKDGETDHILVAANIVINDKEIEESMGPSAYLVADRNLVIESQGDKIYTISRTGGDKLKSILEVKGNGTDYDAVNVSIHRLTFDGGAKWKSDVAVKDRGNGQSKSKANTGDAGRAVIGVSYKGTLNLEKDATIQNGDCTSNIRVDGSSCGSYYYGGGIRVEFTYTNSDKDEEKKMGGGTVNVKVGSVITDCVSEKLGGAIGAYNDAFVNVYGGTICNCYSEAGGAIGCSYRSGSDANTAAHLCVKGGRFYNCYANNGGALIVEGNNGAEIYGGDFDTCVASTASIIYIDGNSKLLIDDANTCTYNNCSGKGKQIGKNTGATLETRGKVEVVAPLACTVTFMSDGNEYGKVNVLKGESLADSVPNVTDVDNKIFKGWFTNERYSQDSLFDADTIVEEDITVYAKWHTHNLSKNVSWDKTQFTMKCDNGDGEDCDYYSVHTVTIDAEDAIYSGEKYDENQYSIDDKLNGFENYVIGKPFFMQTIDRKNTILDSDPCDAGVYYVAVKIIAPDKTEYTIQKKFEISAKALSDEMVEATNDEEAKAVITVTDGTKELVLDKDYNVSVVDKDGNHEITVTGINNYAGSVNKTIKIEKKNGGNGQNGGNGDDNNGGNGQNGGNGDDNNGGNGQNGGNGDDKNGGNGQNGGNGDDKNGGNGQNGGNGDDKNGGNGQNGGDDEIPGNPDGDDVDPNRNGSNGIIVTFDPNGGECDVKSVEIKKDASLPEMPTAKKNGYVFAGWVNGNKEVVSTLSNITSNTVLLAKWDNITLVAKQKLNVASFFEPEMKEYSEKVQKDCIAKGKKFTKSKLKYRYKVLSNEDFNKSVSINALTVSSNQMLPGKASTNKSGILTTKKSGTVAVVFQYREKEGKKWVWKNISDKHLFVAIEKPIVVKAHSRIISGVGQTLELSKILMYENSDKIGSLPNYADYTVESSNKSIATIDPKTGIITAVGKGTTKIKVTYRMKIGQKKDGSDKFSTVKKTIKVKVK